MFEKVGESTETALSVLVEKMDLEGVCSKEMSKSDRAGACCHSFKEKYNKVSWEGEDSAFVVGRLPTLCSNILVNMNANTV